MGCPVHNPREGFPLLCTCAHNPDALRIKGFDHRGWPVDGDDERALKNDQFTNNAAALKSLIDASAGWGNVGDADG